MKKGLVIIFFIFLIYIIFRFIFSYKIFDMPDSFGRFTYVGGNKYDFPICILNPIKTKSLKEGIVKYVEIKLQEGIQFSKEEIDSIKYAVNYNRPYDSKKHYEIISYEEFRWWFFDRLNKLPDFEIISINTSNKMYDSLLLQVKDDPKIQCVVLIDKKTRQVIRIVF